MSFVVPKSVAEQGAPRASSEEVPIETVPGGTFAVYRFSGSWNLNRFEEATKKLLSWVEQNNLTPSGAPRVANYDPPFTPPFLRRNEILIRLSAE